MSFDVRGHQGQARRHRLKQHDPEALTTSRGAAEDVGRVVVRRQLLVGDPADEHDVVDTPLWAWLRPKPGQWGCIGIRCDEGRRGAELILLFSPFCNFNPVPLYNRGLSVLGKKLFVQSNRRIIICGPQTVSLK